VAGRVHAHVLLSAAARWQGNPGAALPHALDGLATATTLDARILGIATHEVANVYDAMGEPQRAIEYHRTALRLATGVQTRFLSVEYSIALGLAEHRLRGSGSGSRPAEQVDLAQVLRHTRDSAYRGLEGAALAALAEIARDAGDAEEAGRCARESARIQNEAGWYSDGAVLATIMGHQDAAPVGAATEQSSQSSELGL
jgi:hypothetical protein